MTLNSPTTALNFLPGNAEHILMLSHGQIDAPFRPDASTEDSGGPEAHTELGQLLENLGLSKDTAPDSDSWTELLTHLEERQAELSRLRQEVVELKRGWSSFENLFRTSPVPMMEQDYTEIEAWMEELRAQGVTRLRDVIDEDLDAIREIAPMIKIVAANPAAMQAVGLPLDHLIGPIDPIIVNQGSERSWMSQLEAVWERRSMAQASFVAATADGEQYDAESTLSVPTVDGEPDFSRAVFSLIDITPHRDEERRMAGLVEAKNRFLASVSHEIRTPLTAILGFARVLEDDANLTEDDRKLMNSSIAEHAQEMSNLVEDLLVAARADIGQLDIIEVKVDVLAEIENTVRAGGSFTTDVRVLAEGHTPYALGDPARVRQILRNLLTNAERYGGPEVTVSVRSSDRWVCVDVADNGDGLPGDDWERIFQPYESAHLSAGRPSAVGIGLTISRQLAELMAGSLEYKYDAGVSVFRLKLPVART